MKKLDCAEVVRAGALPLAGALVLATAGCMPEASDPVGPAVDLTNPASVYCTEQDGTLEIRREAAGEVGYCHLPDGRVVEEWEFFRAS